ncbi:MAG: DUF1343 domain-containing protein [Leptospiraceae bacterium]|nr:DUF1343 domain-containing protein [Leptospiraceae bacterium]MDW8307431.1 DUF1343 domain-containing protein [Leptospiraceae bacterium]
MSGRLFCQLWKKNTPRLRQDGLKSVSLALLFFSFAAIHGVEQNDPREVFLRKELPKYENKNFCLVTNQAGLGRYLLWPPLQDGEPTRLHEIFKDSSNRLGEVFTAEHGLSGQESEEGNNLPLLYNPKSIYRLRESDIAFYIQACDVIVYDLPDAGVRPYTYRTIATTLLRSLHQHGPEKIFHLIDVPNPASHLGIAGPVAQKEKFSILGEEEIPHLPYYTYGELLQYYVFKMQLRVKLYVQPLNGYRPGRFFLEQRFSYYPPSPNLPHFRSLQCYWMMVFFEGTYLEEGRGTKDPFCTFGHPEFDPRDVPPPMGGVLFVPFSFVPSSGRYKNKLVHGYRLEIPDPWEYRPVEAAYKLLLYLKKRYPELNLFKTYPGGYYSLDELCGTESLRRAVQSEIPYEEWLKNEKPKIELFRKNMKQHRIY